MRFYTLSEMPAEGGAALLSSAQAGGSSVRIDRLTIPGELDRPQLVRRIDANRLEIVELDRWAAPLDEMIRRVLAADLAARLSKPQSLTVEIQEFIGDASCAVTLRADWTLQRSGAASDPAVEEIRLPAPIVGPCPTSALPAAMSRALGELSDRIAAGANH